MNIEAMRQALEALELAHPRFGIATEKHKQAITALRAAIEQGEKQDYIKLEAAYFSGLADGKEVVEQYDQTSLELCKECGWRAMIPGDGCLVCARQKAKPVWIPRVHLEAAQREPSMCRVEPTKRLPDFVPLYAAPRQWVGLTEDELKLLWEQYGYKSAMCKPFAHAIEAKLKEKNA